MDQTKHNIGLVTGLTALGMMYFGLFSGKLDLLFLSMPLFTVSFVFHLLAVKGSLLLILPFFFFGHFTFILLAFTGGYTKDNSDKTYFPLMKVSFFYIIAGTIPVVLLIMAMLT